MALWHLLNMFDIKHNILPISIFCLGKHPQRIGTLQFFSNESYQGNHPCTFHLMESQTTRKINFLVFHMNPSQSRLRFIGSLLQEQNTSLKFVNNVVTICNIMHLITVFIAE
jgi:hypothetical protein